MRFVEQGVDSLVPPRLVSNQAKAANVKECDFEARATYVTAF